MQRHAGVLGLSACILSSPYDVPTWMPQILMDLSAHLNDTQPIEVQRMGLIGNDQLIAVCRVPGIDWAKIKSLNISGSWTWLMQLHFKENVFMAKADQQLQYWKY